CEGFAHHYGLLRKQYFACRIVQKIIYNFPQKIVFVLLDPVAQKNLGQMLLTTHLQEQHLFLFFVYLFFVNRLCLLHVRYNLCFHRFANHNFHAFALCQYLHSFYFLALFDYEIACPLFQLISLFAFYKLHNSYVTLSFLVGTNVRHFCSFPAIPSLYSITHYTLYLYSVCSARLLALPTKPCTLITSMHKTFKTFLFFTRKKKQKNLTSATSAKGGFALVARLKKTRDRSYFSKRCAEKSPPYTLVFFILSVMFFVPKAVLSKIKICSTFGFPG